MITIRSCGNHRIVASTIISAKDEVHVYDSVYNFFDKETKAVVESFPGIVASSSNGRVAKASWGGGGGGGGGGGVLTTLTGLTLQPCVYRRIDEPANF